MHDVSPIAERAQERDRIPIARRNAKPSLILHVVRQVSEGVTLCLPAIVGDGLIASSEGNRLEAEESDLLRIVERELNDASNLLVVDAVDDGHNGHNFAAGAMQVIDRL